MALGGEVVDLRRLDLLDQADEVGGIPEVSVVEKEAGIGLVGILIKVVDAAGVEAG